MLLIEGPYSLVIPMAMNPDVELVQLPLPRRRIYSFSGDILTDIVDFEQKFSNNWCEEANTGAFTVFGAPVATEPQEIDSLKETETVEEILFNSPEVVTTQPNDIIRLKKRFVKKIGGAVNHAAKHVGNTAGRAANQASKGATKAAIHVGKKVHENRKEIVQGAGKVGGTALRVGSGAAGQVANTIIPGSGVAIGATGHLGAKALETYTDNAFEGKEKIGKAFKENFNAAGVMTEIVGGGLSSLGPPGAANIKGAVAGALKSEAKNAVKSHVKDAAETALVEGVNAGIKGGRQGGVKKGIQAGLKKGARKGLKRSVSFGQKAEEESEPNPVAKALDTAKNVQSALGITSAGGLVKGLANKDTRMDTIKGGAMSLASAQASKHAGKLADAAEKRIKQSRNNRNRASGRGSHRNPKRSNTHQANQAARRPNQNFRSKRSKQAGRTGRRNAQRSRKNRNQPNDGKSGSNPNRSNALRPNQNVGSKRSAQGGNNSRAGRRRQYTSLVMFDKF